MTYRIFISYSQDDFFARGRKTRNYLAKYIPDSYVYIDQVKEKGKNWRETNDFELLNSDLMILVITPAALHSEEVKREIKIAKENKIRILPCKDNNLEMEWTDIPLELGVLDGIPFGEAEVLRTKLYKEIKKILKKIKPETASELLSSSGEGTIDVLADKSKFELNYSFQEGFVSILKANVDRDICSLTLEINCELPSELTVELPRTLIDAKIQGKDDVFLILADGVEIQFKEFTSNNEERLLTFACSRDMNDIEIIGTEILGITPGKKNIHEHIISLPLGSDNPNTEKIADPEYLKISVGDTVTWSNDDIAAHTITSGNPSDADSVGTMFDSGLILRNAKFSLTFPKAGRYEYFCIVHPWKICVIEVE